MHGKILQQKPFSLSFRQPETLKKEHCHHNSVCLMTAQLATGDGFKEELAVPMFTFMPTSITPMILTCKHIWKLLSVVAIPHVSFPLILTTLQFHFYSFI